MQPILNRRFYLFCAPLVLVVLALIVASGAKLRLNLTPSLPKGIYMLSDSAPARGDYVTLCLSGEFAELALARGYLQPGSCPSGVQPLLKRLVGLPGDNIELAAISIRAEDRAGLPLFSRLPDGVIPQGLALVMTDHPGSFDGRYFGLVPLQSLQRVEPVFLFSNLENQDER